ncbi:hypothetical protein FDUTEX481_05516 [Tolypothrix sp. PCC 7601]|nr:hypothetical protein FDUTEX481_05516 [Tolypothrix sp. PCC 7601]
MEADRCLPRLPIAFFGVGSKLMCSERLAIRLGIISRVKGQGSRVKGQGSRVKGQNVVGRSTLDC